ncbi:MAG: hypothetical protein QXP58_06915, partial [Thermoprotei archaeon]
QFPTISTLRDNFATRTSAIRANIRSVTSSMPLLARVHATITNVRAGVGSGAGLELLGSGALLGQTFGGVALQAPITIGAPLTPQNPNYSIKLG